MGCSHRKVRPSEQVVARRVDKSQTVLAPYRSKNRTNARQLRVGPLDRVRGGHVVSANPRRLQPISAVWLVQVGNALNCAAQLLPRLEIHPGQRADLADLGHRIAAAQFSVRMLALNCPPHRTHGSEQPLPHPWDRLPEDRPVTSISGSRLR